jgi:Cof subfamily protein (haloacid dehalogenase superfamily)
MSAEPILPIRLLALDIDGTLVDDELVLGPATKVAVRAAMERGVAVSLVTGRMVASAMRFARELGLTGPVVGYQGGLIREMPIDGSGRVGKLLVHTPLPAATAREVVRWCLDRGLDPHINHLERFVLRADDPRADDYSAFMGHTATLVDDLVESIRHPATKVLAAGEPPLPSELAELARAHFAGRADVTISHPRFLEFVAPGVSKGRAIRWLARRLKVPLGATMAIGDQWNDLEMLDEVGHGAAMPTAPAGVRAVARYVAAPVAEEGVAQMIEALILADPGTAESNSRRLAAAADEIRATAAETGDGAVIPGVAGTVDVAVARPDDAAAARRRAVADEATDAVPR